MIQNDNFEQIAEALEKAYNRGLKTAKQVELFESSQAEHKLEQLFQAWVGASFDETLTRISSPSIRKNLGNAKSLNLAPTQESPFLLQEMDKDEMANGYEKLSIHYDFYDTRFGQSLLAATDTGVCFIGFSKEKESVLKDMTQRFPNATFHHASNKHIEAVKVYFDENCHTDKNIVLHINGTNFQRKVWQAFLHVPAGSLVSYADISHAIDSPKASRAVGTAVGSNPISYIIPCHRVVRATGELGGYHWGASRKKAMLAWELSQPYK